MTQIPILENCPSIEMKIKTAYKSPEKSFLFFWSMYLSYKNQNIYLIIYLFIINKFWVYAISSENYYRGQMLKK